MMKFLIILLNLLLLINSISAIAKQEKIIKKPLNLKPTKLPTKSVIDEFRHLPAEDLEFIKQLDKQFKDHGDQIKIKVERSNTTKSGNKNSKRTIEGSLGYGYIQNGHTGNYYFSQPHVMHKFTMQDVPKSNHREVATDIEIQQSHSYEIKESDFQPNYARGKQQQQHHEQVYEDPVPVIVLRIPGPQKYALHLQALLQQYLELRAAMYIQALEDEERRGHLHHPNHYVQQQHQAMQYYRQPMISSVAPPQMVYHHQPQPIMYYHQQPQQHHQQQHGYQQYIQVQHVADDYHNIPAGDQSYYHHHSSVHPSVTPGYLPTAQEHPTSFINFVTPSYDASELQHQQPQHENDDDPHISENYPSDKHTRVIYKKKNRVQPGIVYHQSEVQQPIVVAEQHEEAYQHEQYNPNQQHHHEVQVHQHRTKPPFNYHIAVSTLSPSHEELHERHHPKRMVQLTKEQFEKAKRMMLKRNRGSLLRPAMIKS